MRNLKSLLLLFVVSILTVSCFKDNDDEQVTASEINDFVWKGMNLFYLYKDNIPNLSDDRFTSDESYASYLNGFSKPEDLFESLIYERETADKFSWIVDDYIALEQQLNGVYKTNGMEFGLFLAPNSTTQVMGVVRLVLPNSDASLKGVKRGDIFYGIDGVNLNQNNYLKLLSQETYTLNLGVFNDNGTVTSEDDFIQATNQSINLIKSVYNEDTVFESKIFEVNGQKVGYLIYNGFTDGSENKLNSVFGNFKSNNVQHLVLDLRYNSGGRVSTETVLASMITGQFKGQLFAKLIYNSNFDSTNYNFTDQVQNGNIINSLGLNKLYVLTTSRTASASEGLINSLTPYITVIQIGTNTTGKTQASVTLYDSPNFERQGANPNHTYAMQPLVADGVNINNKKVPSTGLMPSIGFEYEERPLNYGILGDVNEPMLAIALADIENSTSKIATIKSKSKQPLFKELKDTKLLNPKKGGMIIK